jgi:4-carboxymuconolactone decarboxylase
MSREGRIPLPTVEQLSPTQRAVYEEVVRGPRGRLVGPLRAAILSPDLAGRWSRLGEFLRYGTSIPPRQSELVILVTGRRWTSHVEWAIHSRIALEKGVPAAVVEAIRRGAPPAFDDPDDAAVYEFARQLQQAGRVDLAAYRAVGDRWGDVGLVELTAIVGYYTMVAMTLNAHEIPATEEEPSDLEDARAEGLHVLPPASGS